MQIPDSATEFKCTACQAEFLEEDMGEEQVCPDCGGDSLFQRELRAVLIDILSGEA